MKRRTGFTLIEVLVVVAIIALLISILLPSLSRARMQAKSAVCQSNLKQQGYAALMYGHDNKGTLPGSWGDSIEKLPYKSEPGSANTAFRQPFIHAYRMSAIANIFYCPANDVRPWKVANFFMSQGAYGNSGDSGRILYWWVANPPPNDAWRFRDTNGVDADGNAVQQSEEWRTSANQTPKGWNDECIERAEQRWSKYSNPPMRLYLSPSKVVMSTDQSRQRGGGWRFFHGNQELTAPDTDTSKLQASWKNSLYGDMHVAAVRAFQVIPRWGPANPAGW